VIREMPLDSLDELITKSGVSVDDVTTLDGNGSIRIDAPDTMTVRIAEFDLEPIDNAQLIYRAHVRADSLLGRAYLEMWCVFPGMGEFFSRSLHNPISGTTEWVTMETPFLLEEDQVPKRVRLNVVVEGVGTVWIDDAALLQADLAQRPVAR
jgi:hypothetical protein